MADQKRKIAVFDIDGCLADDSHRAHLRDAKKWDEYFGACSDDAPIRGISDDILFGCLANCEADPVFLTTRNETIRGLTAAWLEKNFELMYKLDLFDPNVMIMRSSRDFRPAPKVKVEEMKRLMQDCEIVVAIDDDPETCKAYQEL